MDKITAWLADNQENIINLIAHGLAALLFIVVGHYLARIISAIVKKILRKREAADLLTNFMGRVVYIVIFFIPLMAGLKSLGLDVTSLMAVLGAAGLAIGLALKDSLSNFAAGVMISVLGPFRKDDFVEISGLTGKVTNVSLFSTELTTADNKLITLPNNSIIASPITNYTAKNRRRIDMVIGVGYEDDLKVARQVMLETVNAHPGVLKDPEPVVMLLELADSSVNFAVRPWTLTEDYWTVRDELLESIKTGLEAAGCSIPYPQQDIHLHKVP